MAATPEIWALAPVSNPISDAGCGGADNDPQPNLKLAITSYSLFSRKDGIKTERIYRPQQSFSGT